MSLSPKKRAVALMNLEKARAAARIAKQKRLVDCICQNCGKQFTRRPSEVKLGMGKYCSRPCLYAGRKRETATKFGSNKN